MRAIAYSLLYSLIIATGTASASCDRFLLFGGERNQVFLGCVNCGPYAGNSIFNNFTDCGDLYSTRSIWNEYSEFGSDYGRFSPWNPMAEKPPVLVDDCGNFFGFFTVNRDHPARTAVDWARRMLGAGRDDARDFDRTFDFRTASPPPPLTPPADFVAPPVTQWSQGEVASGAAASPWAGSVVGQQPPEGCADRIESRIVGTFTGWTRETKFRLGNGQVWQLAVDETLTSRPLENPRVMLRDASKIAPGVFVLSVEGVDEITFVKRVE